MKREGFSVMDHVSIDSSLESDESKRAAPLC